MKFLNWLRKTGKDSGKKMQLTDETVLDLIHYLEDCDDGCEEVFRALDQYAEIQIREEDAARLMPLVHDHLETCTECCDAYEALLDVLTKASTPPEQSRSENPPNLINSSLPPELNTGQSI